MYCIKTGTLTIFLCYFRPANQCITCVLSAHQADT